MTWQQLTHDDPDLAAFGAKRLHGVVAYLGTLRTDGAPRVHPVTPILTLKRLFVFMEPTSPKGHDLRRDGRFALHSSVRDSDGSDGEFVVFGSARPVDDAETRAVATAGSSYAPQDRYVLFELTIHGASSTEYPSGGAPVRRRWTRGNV
jgi:hypothetical protein